MVVVKTRIPLTKYYLGPLAVVCAALAFASGAQGKGPVLAAIKEIPHEGLYRELFSLSREAEVKIETISSGWPQEDILFSYAWILDLETRKPAWVMEASEAEDISHDNVRVRETIRLPAGDYALCFSAYGGMFPIKKKLKLLKMFELGTVDVFGGVVKWDRYGEPSEWKAIVRAADESFPSDAFSNPGRLPDMGALLEFRRIRSGEYRRKALEVREPIRLRVLAVGEYWAREQSFADGAWIEDWGTCELIWKMTLMNTKPAGGAKKNRVFDEEVKLSPGRYRVCYASDDSHAFEDWNAQPPYDADSWGLTLIPTEAIGEGAVILHGKFPEQNVIAQIRNAGDSEFRRVRFGLSRGTDVCIRAFGEWARKEDRHVDFGWIEDAATLEKVWSMEFDHGDYAAGEDRNRIVRDKIHLDAGTYFLGYLTDDSHSCTRWHDSPPFDPASWGITLRGVGEDFSMDIVEAADDTEAPSSIILAPLGDGARRRVRFEVKAPTTVKIIALGEGMRGEMYDYGWLLCEDTGEKVWVMRYEDTFHGGGDKKNRRTERVLTLEPGRYALHFRTDDSHSYEDWNAKPPRDPYFWGVTLFELSE